MRDWKSTLKDSRKRGETCQELAQRLGVDYHTVSRMAHYHGHVFPKRRDPLDLLLEAQTNQDLSDLGPYHPNWSHPSRRRKR